MGMMSCSSYRSCGVRGCDNFSWLLHPKYGFRNDARIESFPLAYDCPDNILAFGPPRVNELRVEALGDVWLEFRCDVDHLEKPV